MLRIPEIFYGALWLRTEQNELVVLRGRGIPRDMATIDLIRRTLASLVLACIAAQPNPAQ